MAYLPVIAAGVGALLSAGSRMDAEKVNARLDDHQRGQEKFNYNMAQKCSEQGESQRQLQSQHERLSSRTDNLQSQFSEASGRLERFQSDADNLRRNHDRTSLTLQNFQSDQNRFNTAISERGARLEESHRQFSEQQLVFNNDIKSQTARLQEKVGENSTELAMVKSRTDCLKDDQNRINIEIARVDGRVDNFRADQTNFNLGIIERNARMEEQQKMFHEQQGMFNSELNSRTIAMQEKMGSNATKLELVQCRADFLQHGQEAFNQNLSQVNLRLDQLRDENNQMCQTIAERSIRNEVRQTYYADGQKSLNENFFQRTNALDEKVYETKAKLEVINVRAESLLKGQDQIDSTLKLERQIAEDRLREQTRHNEMLAVHNNRIETKQNCFINDQKTLNEHITNRCDDLRQMLGDFSKKVDLINCNVENLQHSQQKVKVDLESNVKHCLEASKELELINNATQETRTDQMQMSDLLKTLSTQMTEISIRTKAVEGCLEEMQRDFKRVNEMCIKFDATICSYGKCLDDLRTEINSCRGEVAFVSNT